MLVVLAAVPMVEAMVALVLVDQLMLQRAQGELFPINSALQQPVELPGLEAASLRNWMVSLDIFLVHSLPISAWYPCWCDRTAELQKKVEFKDGMETEFFFQSISEGNKKKKKKRKKWK